MIDPRIPVTLLTGFLGAGKTTLLNTLLNDASAGKIAVIVNEFGEAGLDHDLIEESSEETILMSSGCLCCSVRGELSQTISTLLMRRNAEELDFDRLVIETTGLADPGPILQTFAEDRFLSRMTRLDGVVTVVDALNGGKTLDAQFEAVQQAAMADLIVISKPDLVAPEYLIDLESRLRGLNSGVQIRHSVRGAGLTGALWGLSSLRQGVSADEALDWMAVPGKAADPLSNLSGFASAPPAAQAFAPQRHDSRIQTASITIDHPLADATLDNWLRMMKSLRRDNILRIKGLIFLEDLKMPFVFHGVQGVFEDPVAIKEWPHESRVSRVVIIARDVPLKRLKSDLEQLRARPMSASPANSS
ncbi:MAG: CobW family GTP-binding protein [Mangrovicoccus sp.]